MIFRKPKPQTPLVITTAHRRRWLASAMNGASPYEREALIRQALATMPREDFATLIRDIEREIWIEQKP